MNIYFHKIDSKKHSFENISINVTNLFIRGKLLIYLNSFTKNGLKIKN